MYSGIIVEAIEQMNNYGVHSWDTFTSTVLVSPRSYNHSRFFQQVACTGGKVKEQRRKRMREVKLSSRSRAPTRPFFLHVKQTRPRDAQRSQYFLSPLLSPRVFLFSPPASAETPPLGRGDRGRFAATPERSPSQSHILRLFKVFCNP